jgi:UDP-GlcNAc:undecaprenyl-phosphate GlcNAc-1-phosphate transferase
VRVFARRLGAVSAPSADRWNTRPVPLLGGVAIWAGTLAALAAGPALPADVLLMVGAGTAMFGLGLVDDFVRLKPMTKLIWQVVTACAAVLVLAPPVVTGSPIADALLSIAWIVAVTNAVNLLDNMDGLCAGVAAIGAVALALSLGGDAPDLRLLALALAGAAAGFLWYNFHPASIFMGDSGSLFLGTLLALLALRVGRQASAGLVSAMAVPVVLMVIPLFDTLFVTVVRKLSARAASAGGRDHTSHRLVALGFSEPRAVLLLYGLAVTAGTAAVLLSRARLREASLLAAVLLVGLVVLGVRLARVNVYGEAEFSALRDRAITPLLTDLAYKRRVFEVLLDSCLICLAYYAAYVVRFDDQFDLYYYLLVQSLPVVLACGLTGLYVAGVYRGIWRYISLDDLPTYGKGLLFGGLTPVFVLVYLYHFEGYPRSVFVLHTLLLGVMLLGSRIGFRALGELSHRRSGNGGVPALVYGAGDRGALLVREMRSHGRAQYRLLGFVDDDPSKANRGIHGLQVLGGGDALAAILARTGAETVIVSTTLRPPARAALLAACHQAGAAVVQFEFRLDPVDASLAGE